MFLVVLEIAFQWLVFSKTNITWPMMAVVLRKAVLWTVTVYATHSTQNALLTSNLFGEAFSLIAAGVCNLELCVSAALVNVCVCISIWRIFFVTFIWYHLFIYASINLIKWIDERKAYLLIDKSCSFYSCTKLKLKDIELLALCKVVDFVFKFGWIVGLFP